MESALYPITVLIEELKAADPQVRAGSGSAARRIAAGAAAAQRAVRCVVCVAVWLLPASSLRLAPCHSALPCRSGRRARRRQDWCRRPAAPAAALHTDSRRRA